MYTIKFCPTNPNEVLINGKLYKHEPEAKIKLDSFYDFSEQKCLWSEKSASEIFFDINNREPKDKAEITSFALSALTDTRLTKRRIGTKRLYLVPPVYSL